MPINPLADFLFIRASLSLIFAFHVEITVRFEISLLSLEQQLSLTRGPPHIIFTICLVSVKALEFYAKRLLVDIHIQYLLAEQQ